MEVGKLEKSDERPNLKGDIWNLIFLTYLYVLQGIPYGLSLALPLILQQRKQTTYADQAEFSFVQYSFCFKLLWAPIVDCVFSKRIGRRKTWLIPTQYCIGIILLIMSMKMDDWLGSEDGRSQPQLTILSVSFFLCIFFASTQDIAVDGWSLTILKRRNVGHASTCYSVGYALGQFFAFFLFIILDSKDFCNIFRSIPQDRGILSFADFIFFWSLIFLVSTTLVLIFKKDRSLDFINNSTECRLDLKESYQRLWMICRIGPIQTLCFLLFTCQVILGPVQGVAPLKLIDAGMHPDKYVLLTVPSLPFQFVLPFVLSKQLVGPRSMRTFIIAYALKCIFGVFFATCIFCIPYVRNEDKVLPTWYYWILLSIYNVDNLTMYVIWIAALAFFSRVSDPRFGGIYLTVLNTVTNIGYYWPISACLWLLDLMTIKTCASSENMHDSSSCEVILDGFYVEVILCTSFGFLWLYWGRKCIQKLEKLELASWTVDGTRKDIPEKKSLTGKPNKHLG